MTRPACIASDFWDALPAELRPGLLVIVAAFESRIANQEARIADLEARLKRDSSNSSRPPSADPPHRKPAPPRKPSTRKRGGQPGHRRHDRARLEPDEVVHSRPDRCHHCHQALQGDDPEPIVRQVLEVPLVKPRVVEHRSHRLTCPRCGVATRAAISAQAGPGFGPRTQAIGSILSGEGRLSKRRVARLMKSLFGLPISPGSVCDLERRTAEALAPIHARALDSIRQRPANVDETGWREGRRRDWLWAAVGRGLGVFRIAAGRGRDAFEDLMGRSPAEVVTSDRYSAYSHLPAERRQICWAHLRRDFQAMIDRGDAGSAIGRDLLMNADILFEAWSKVRAGEHTRADFEAETLSWLRPEFQMLLRQGCEGGSKKTAATCRAIRKVERSLWSFATTEGVEPTNNDAERALRHAVCWRKTSFGTDSASGSRFVECFLTAMESCRRQGRDLLEFLVQAITAHRSGGAAPSILPSGP